MTRKRCERRLPRERGPIRSCSDLRPGRPWRGTPRPNPLSGPSPLSRPAPVLPGPDPGPAPPLPGPSAPRPRPAALPRERWARPPGPAAAILPFGSRLPRFGGGGSSRPRGGPGWAGRGRRRRGGGGGGGGRGGGGGGEREGRRTGGRPLSHFPRDRQLESRQPIKCSRRGGGAKRPTGSAEPQLPPLRRTPLAAPSLYGLARESKGVGRFWVRWLPRRCRCGATLRRDGDI